MLQCVRGSPFVSVDTASGVEDLCCSVLQCVAVCCTVCIRGSLVISVDTASGVEDLCHSVLQCVAAVLHWNARGSLFVSIDSASGVEDQIFNVQKGQATATSALQHYNTTLQHCTTATHCKTAFICSHSTTTILKENRLFDRMHVTLVVFIRGGLWNRFFSFEGRMALVVENVAPSNPFLSGVTTGK